MKTKGALAWNLNQPWTIEEIEIGDPRRGEVKVQLETAGLRHSDHHLITGDIPMAAFPILGGHEGAGIITEVGPDVEGLAIGGSAVRSAAVTPGEDVAIVGIGGVGVAALQGAVIAGARRVFAIDPHQWKREQAVKFGATHTYPDVESAMAGTAEATMGGIIRYSDADR